MISGLFKNKKYVLIALLSIIFTSSNTFASSDLQSKEDVLKAIEEAKALNVDKDRRFSDLLVEADKAIFETLDKANTALDTLIDTVIQTSELEEQTRDALKGEVNLVKTDIDDLKKEASEIITTMRETYMSEGDKVAKAYDEYSKDVSLYYDGEIDKNGLLDAGKDFKAKVGAINRGADKAKIDNLLATAKEIDNKTKHLQEKILNEIANNKDYSDEDEDDNKDENLEKTSSLLNEAKIQRYSYSYHTKYNHVYLKSEYAPVDSSFLISHELMCNGINKEHLDQDVSKLRDCIVRAKTEKEYFAIKGLCGCSTSKVDDCNPFSSGACSLYTDYKNKGVYKHILEDYDAANIANIAKTKQYAHAWLGKYDNGKCVEGTKCELGDKIQDGSPDNTRAAYQVLSLVELEAPKNWSSLRRVDALHRVKDAINYFMGSDKLYLDGRNDGRGDSPYNDFLQATNSRPGHMKIENIEQDVAPNVFLYVCGLTAEDVSASSEDAGNDEKIKNIEKEIAKCMKKYATWVDKGTDQDKQENDYIANANKKLWREKERGAATDSMFNNFTISSINLYKSSLDYQPNATEDNIASLGKAIDAPDGLGDYAVGAKINYYTTNQILSIIDADAIELQTEIIQNLGELGYNFFFREKEGGNQ